VTFQRESSTKFNVLKQFLVRIFLDRG